jgi:hypothetical protein
MGPPPLLVMMAAYVSNEFGLRRALSLGGRGLALEVGRRERKRAEDIAKEHGVSHDLLAPAELPWGPTLQNRQAVLIFQGAMPTQIARQALVREVQERLSRHPVVALVGARQVGKTTLARDLTRLGSGAQHTFDLESPRDLERLRDPLTALEHLEGLVVLDEIHRRPELFPTLRVLADRAGPPARFLVLGSASPDLLRQSSESLAGRISYLRIEGFGLDEIGADRMRELWLRGGFPRSFLAPTEAASLEWRRDFIATFLERDLPGFGIAVPSATLRRFWTMLAHWHGQVWNAAEFSRSLGVSDASVRRYVDVLASTLVVRRLEPWFENLAKRQVKSPKVYVADSGLLHALLEIESWSDLEVHPRLGASWEGFLVDGLARRLGARPEECFFWRTQSGAELDLLVVRGRERRGFEIKYTTAPGVTPSMRIALEDLKLGSLDVVHAGAETYPLAPGIRAVAARRLLEDVEPL